MLVHSIIVLCGLSLGASGGPIDQPERSDRLEDAVRERITPEAGEQEPVHSTAEDVLSALQRQRPLNVVIPPGSTRDTDEPHERTRLYPEGWALVSRLGRPVYQNDRWIFLLDEADDPPPLGLLPNAILEGMVRSSAGAPSPLHFVLSGELTVFSGENYVLPRLALRSNAPPAGPPAVGATGDSVLAEPEGSGDALVLPCVLGMVLFTPG